MSRVRMIRTAGSLTLVAIVTGFAVWRLSLIVGGFTERIGEINEARAQTEALQVRLERIDAARGQANARLASLNLSMDALRTDGAGDEDRDAIETLLEGTVCRPNRERTEANAKVGVNLQPVVCAGETSAVLGSLDALASSQTRVRRINVSSRPNGALTAELIIVTPVVETAP